jgi:hypothetical protein
MPLRSTVDTLPCGAVTARLTSLCTASGDLRCADQTMTIRPEAAETPVRDVPLLGKTEHGLSAIVQSWTCVMSPSGLHYLLLDDRCAPGSASCSDDDAQEEWLQLIDTHGHNLDLNHGWDPAKHDATMRQAGLAGLLTPPGVKMHALSFTSGK